MNIDRQDADKILCPASFLRATLVEIMEVVMGPYQGFISQPVTGNRRAPVPVYRTGLTGYRSEPVEFKSKFK